MKNRTRLFLLVLSVMFSINMNVLAYDICQESYGIQSDSEGIGINHGPKDNQLEAVKPSYKKGAISSGVSESHIPFKVYTAKKRSDKIVFVFGGKNRIGEDCGKSSFYKEIKDKRFVPGYNVVFVQKEEGNWKQYSQEAIGSMIDEVMKDLKAKKIYFVGFSQGVYNSKYIVTSHKKWHGGLFVDGAGDFTWVKKNFVVSAFVAGYIDEGYGNEEYFDYYYEPADKAFATRNKDIHQLVFDWAVLPEDLFVRYNKDGLIKKKALNAIDILVYEL